MEAARLPVGKTEARRNGGVERAAERGPSAFS